MADPVTAAIIFIPIVIEAVEDVKLIVDTLAAIGSLTGAFQQKSLDTVKILNAIKDAETEIVQATLEAEFRTHHVVVLEAARLWQSRDQPRLKEFGLSKKTLGLDPRPLDEEEAKGWRVLDYLPGEIRTSIRALGEAMFYFVGRPIPPERDPPAVLSTITMCASLLATLNIVEAGIFNIGADGSSVESSSQLARIALKDGHLATQQWEIHYLAKRREVLHLKAEIEREFHPPRTVGYTVTASAPQDEFFENLTGRSFALGSTLNDGSSDRGIIMTQWNRSSNGSALHSLHRSWEPIFAQL